MMCSNFYFELPTTGKAYTASLTNDADCMARLIVAIKLAQVFAMRFCVYNQ